MAQPALWKLGIFAVFARRTQGDWKILVNVRTDQEEQRKLAGLPDDWAGVIVDIPGGTFQQEDESLEACLEREVSEKTGGCEAKMIHENFLGPFPLINPTTGSAKDPHDLALAAACELIGEPRPTPEAREHRWVTWKQLEAEEVVRLPGKLGKNGRMAKMITTAIIKVFKKTCLTPLLIA